MSDCFPFPRGEESQIILGRSPDSQVKLVLPSFRISAFPDLQPSGEWKVFSLITVAGPRRTYTGFPFMPLRAPRMFRQHSITQERESGQPVERAVQRRPLKRRSVTESGAISMRQNDCGGA